MIAPHLFPYPPKADTESVKASKVTENGSYDGTTRL